MRLWELRVCLQVFAWQKEVPKGQPGPTREWLAYSIFMKYNWRNHEALCVPGTVTDTRHFSTWTTQQHENNSAYGNYSAFMKCCKNRRGNPVSHLSILLLWKHHRFTDREVAFKKKKNHTINFLDLWMKTVLSKPCIGEGTRFSYKYLRMKKTISWRNGSIFLYKGCYPDMIIFQNLKQNTTAC